jgi:HK97 family phage portal protein
MISHDTIEERETSMNISTNTHSTPTSGKLLDLTPLSSVTPYPRPTDTKTSPSIASNSTQNLQPLYSLFQTANGVYMFQNMTLQQITQNYEKVAPLYTAVTRVASAVADLPIKLFDTKTGTPQYQHPAYLLFKNPNRFYQKLSRQFIYWHIAYKILYGNSYWVLTGNTNNQPLELTLLNPQNITFNYETSQDGFPQSFDYTPVNGAKTVNYRRARSSKSNRQVYVPTSNPSSQELYHIANFNPDQNISDLGGQSELLSVYYQLNYYMQANVHNLSVLTKGARPSGIFILKNQSGAPVTLSDEAFDRLRIQVADSYSGAANAGTPMIAEGGLEWEPMEMSPRDLDFDKLMERAEESIFKAVGIPIQLVNSTKATAGNMVELRRDFYENRALPLGDETCEFLNQFLLARYPSSSNKNLEFQVDRDEIDVLLDQRIKRRQELEKSSVHLISEKRQIMKLPRVEGSDKAVDPNGRPTFGS